MVYTPIDYNGINTIFAAANHEGDLIVNRVNTNAPKVLTDYEHLQNTTVFLEEVKALIAKVIPQINSEIDRVSKSITSKKDKLRFSKKAKAGKKELLNQLYRVREDIQFAVKHHQNANNSEIKEQREFADSVGANFIDMSHLSANMSVEDMAKAVHDAMNRMN